MEAARVGWGFDREPTQCLDFWVYVGMILHTKNRWLWAQNCDFGKNQLASLNLFEFSKTNGFSIKCLVCGGANVESWLVGSFVSEADVDGVLEIEWLGKLDMAAKGSTMEVMDDSGAAKEGFEFGIRMWLVKSQEHHQTKKTTEWKKTK